MGTVMKKLVAPVVIAVAVAVFLGCYIEYSRSIPENLPVFFPLGEILKNGDKFFYSLKYSYDTAKKYNPCFECMTITDAKKHNMKMSNEFKDNYPICFHSYVGWFLIDRGIMRSNCAWNNEGKWITPGGLLGIDDITAPKSPSQKELKETINNMRKRGVSSEMLAVLEKIEDGERRPGESDDTYKQRLLRLWEETP